MNSIEITDTINRVNFLRYLSKFISDTDLSCSPDIKNFSILFNSSDVPCITPSYGEFKWIDKVTGNEFIILYCEEGDPVSIPIELAPMYFKRFKVSHPNLSVLKEFVARAITYKEPPDNDKITIYKSSHKGYFEQCCKIYSQNIDTGIYIPQEIKKSVISHIDNFLLPNTKARYIKFGRTYKTGILLTGVPGTGKSALIKAIAGKYKRTVYVVSFSKKLDDDHFIDLIRDIKSDSILLFEDIDAYFVNREPQDINVSFSALLNVLDGVYSSTTGCITFMTANNPDRLDPALIRPGRIDKIVRFDYPKKSEIRMAFCDIIDDVEGIDKNKEFEEFYAHIKGIKISMAGIIDYLFRYYKDREYITNIQELIDQTHTFHEIVNDKTDKLYS